MTLFPSPDGRLYCLLQSLEAHPGLADGLAPVGLLSPAEQARCDGFVVAKRRRDWLLGRWTAKHLLQSYLAQAHGVSVRLDEVEIRAGEDGAPYAWAGERLPLSLSISHSGPDSFCALCEARAGHAGADVEQIEPREPSLPQTFFTPAEIAAVESVRPAERDAYITAVWSAKEAALKTLHTGLRADTRQVDVAIAHLGPQWQPVLVTLQPALLPVPTSAVACWLRVEPHRVLSLALLS